MISARRSRSRGAGSLREAVEELALVGRKDESDAARAVRCPISSCFIHACVWPRCGSKANPPEARREASFDRVSSSSFGNPASAS